ncbi:MAG: septum formation initiator family protein [Paludibacteraceae bacterium]|nr:septum formation initiator family protein [Paludibacteraceae bacterium]
MASQNYTAQTFVRKLSVLADSLRTGKALFDCHSKEAFTSCKAPKRDEVGTQARCFSVRSSSWHNAPGLRPTMAAGRPSDRKRDVYTTACKLRGVRPALKDWTDARRPLIIDTESTPSTGGISFKGGILMSGTSAPKKLESMRRQLAAKEAKLEELTAEVEALKLEAKALKQRIDYAEKKAGTAPEEGKQ